MPLPRDEHRAHLVTTEDLETTDGDPWRDDARLRVLVAAVASADQAALRELYDLTSARLLHLLGEVADTPLVEDVLVATYARVWRDGAATRQRETGIMCWLTRLALGELVTRRRQTPV